MITLTKTQSISYKKPLFFSTTRFAIYSAQVFKTFRNNYLQMFSLLSDNQDDALNKISHANFVPSLEGIINNYETVSSLSLSLQKWSSYHEKLWIYCINTLMNSPKWTVMKMTVSRLSSWFSAASMLPESSIFLINRYFIPWSSCSFTPETPDVAMNAFGDWQQYGFWVGRFYKNG